MATFRKERTDAPEGFFRCEAAGLQWLAGAGGVRCVDVIGADENHLELERLTETAPSRQSAFEFGAQLARTHNAGAPAFGSPPAGWGGPGYFGPMTDPLPMSYAASSTWGSFYAGARLLPLLEMPRASQSLSDQTRKLVRTLIDRLQNGDFDDGDLPSRLHGDLWAGNVMWTRDGVVLIDPAAHGGHRETDLAFLALFGCPFLDAVLEGYQDVYELRDGWRERVPLHQLYPLMVHVILFGGSYTARTEAAAQAAVGLPSF